jgi:hypothetical protein
MKTTMKKKTLFLVVMAFGLSACNNDTEIDYEQCLATFSCGINDATSTRMTDITWDKGDAIGISAASADNMTTATNIKYSTDNGDGIFTAATASSAITFGSTKTVEFTAYYPYTADNNIVDGNISVSTDANYQGSAIDYMFASGSGKSAKPNVALQFSHKMSRVILNFKTGNGVSTLENMDFTLSGLILNGKFSTSTGEATATDTQATDFKFSPTNTAFSNDNKSVSQSLIFFPQELKSISIELTVNSKKYTATLTLPTINNRQGLTAGHSTSYNITVNSTSLTTSEGTIIGWSETEGEISSTTLGNHTAETAVLYDIAMSDGTFVTVWSADDDSNYTKLLSNINAMSDSQRAGAVGIVYYKAGESSTDAPTMDDDILQTDHPSCTHGYILALKDASRNGDSRLSTKWQKKAQSVYSDFQSSRDKMNPTNSKYQSTIITTVNNNEQLNKAIGYNNTQVLRAYNYYSAASGYNVIPIDSLDNYAAKNVAPRNSSGWFLPSPKELMLLQGTSISYKGSAKSDQFSTIQIILEALGGSNAQLYKWYWTSSEFGSGDSNACQVSFDGTSYGSVSSVAKTGIGYIRAVCAF